MAFILADRVKETSTSTGTTAITLSGAATGFQTFSAAIGNANSTFYTIADQGGANWEVGIGTYTSSGNTLTRTTVLSSSNSGSLVNFTSGTKDVFVTYPSERAVATDVANSFTNLQSFSGSTSALAAYLVNAKEKVTVTTLPGATLTLYANTQSILYYTSNTANNWVLNITHASTPTTLSSVLAVGESITVSYFVTNGATAYYNTSVQVDGTTTGVTTKWLGGAPSAGNASAVDAYSYTVIKTAATPTYTVFASQVRYA